MKDGDFAIQANRFGAIVTQIFPLLSAKLQLPLKWVMINYSAGLVLYYFGTFWLCARVFKNERIGLAMVLFSTLMVSYTFWWMQIEFAQGIALTILFFGFIAREKPWKSYHFIEIALFFLLLFAITYFHPLLPFVFFFLILFFLLEQNRIEKKVLFAAATVFSGILYIKNELLPAASYDATATEGIKNFKALFPNYLDLLANKNFIQYCITDYYLLPIGLLIVIGTYLYLRKYLHLLLVLVFSCGYLLLVNVSFYQGMPQFHIESFYLPLSIFIIFPLAYEVFPRIRNRYALIAILSIILTMRLLHIGKLHQPYTARLHWQKQLLEKTRQLPHQKLILDQKEVPLDTLMMSWGASYEFWLLSSLQNPENPRSIIIAENPGEFDWAMDDPAVFITKWGAFKYSELPKRYFNFADTSRYQKLEWQTIQ